MIFDSKTPGAMDACMVDTDTGQEITYVCRADSETGFVERIVVDGIHGLYVTEERRNFRVIHKPTGKLMCQHPR